MMVQGGQIGGVVTGHTNAQAMIEVGGKTNFNTQYVASSSAGPITQAETMTLKGGAVETKVITTGGASSAQMMTSGGAGQTVLKQEV